MRLSKNPVPRWVSLALLGVLAAVTLVAVLFAVTQAREVSARAGTVPTITEMPRAEAPTTPTEAPVEPVAEVQSPTMQRLLAVSADGTHLLRAHVGSCPASAGSLELSTDDGSSWQTGTLSNAGGLTRLMQLDTRSAEVDSLVALNADCTPVSARSFIGGVDWEPAAMEAVWFIDPVDATIVHGPAGAPSVGCQVVGLSSVGDRAIVLCANSTALVSGDGGASWSAPVAVPNGAAVGVTPAQFVVVSVAEPDCAGVRTRAFDGAALGDPGACVDVADAGDGNVAVAGSDETLYLWAGTAFLRSADFGGSWS